MIGTGSEVSAGLCTRKFKYGFQSREHITVTGEHPQSSKGGFVGNPVLYVTVKDSKSPLCVSYGPHIDSFSYGPHIDRPLNIQPEKECVFGNES